MSLQEKSSLLEDLFREYYSKADLLLPDDIEYREFAYQPFRSHSYVRHLSFRTRDEVIDFFSRNPPLHLYYSSATYLHPSIEDMDAKGWRGSDLLFDIDADHVEECVSNNWIKRYYVCPDCRVLSENSSEDSCRCSEETVDIIDPECIRATARVALDLVDVLIEELGVSKRYIEVNFSGNRGFHVRVFEDRFRELGREERRIIAEYVSAREYSVKRDIERGLILLPPRVGDGGIRGRISRRMIRYLDNETIKRYMISSRAESLEIIKRLDKDLLREYEDRYDKYASIPIDTMVTIDISRLVRIPNSINGKSGLLTKRVELSELEEFKLSARRFSPFEDLRVFIEIKYKIPEIRFLDHRFQAKTQAVYEVPGSLGVFLELKGLGRIKKII